jgi:hypothetical protein
VCVCACEIVVVTVRVFARVGKINRVGQNRIYTP